MKKKSVLLLLAIAGVLAFSGCQNESTTTTGGETEETAEETAVTAESLAADLVTNMESVESVKQNTSFDFGANINVAEYDMSMDMSMSMNLDMDLIADPYSGYASGNVVVSAMGEEMNQEIEEYLTSEGDQVVVYVTTDGGATWSKSTSTEEEAENMSALYSNVLFESIADGTISAELREDTETVGDSTCHVLDVTIPGDQLMDVIGEVGMGMDAMFEDITAEDLADTETVMTVYIDEETGLPAKTSSDLQSIGSVFMSAAMGMGDTEGYEVSVETFMLEQTFTGYNTVDTITIPEEALNAEETEDAGDVLNSLG